MSKQQPYDLVYDHVPSQEEFFNDLKRQIVGEINNHGPLITKEQIIAEIERLRQLRYRNFDRRFEHTLYSRYSNRIGTLKLHLKAMGYSAPKAKRHRTKGLPPTPVQRTPYEIYRDLYYRNEISPEQFAYYTRENGGVPVPDRFMNEYKEIINKHKA